MDRHAPAPVRRAPPAPAALKPMPKRAMVLAAGLGLRMRPLTDTTPKPLLKVADRTMLDQTLDHLAAAGVDAAVVNVHHLAAQVEQHLAARNGQLPDVILSDECDRLLESGGGVLKALALLGDAPFFVLNGDMIYRDGGAQALVRLASFWNPNVMDALLLVMPGGKAVGHDGPGDFFLDPDGRLRRRGQAAHAPYVFMGVQILKPELFQGFDLQPFSLNRIYDKALASGRLFGLVHDGFWAHVGTPDAITAAEHALRMLPP
jgi:MurNAc alpha-1-phosphate uridylyltransferase